MPQYTGNIKGKVKSLRHLGQGSVTSRLEKMIQDITGEWNLPAANQKGKDREQPTVAASQKPTTVMLAPSQLNSLLPILTQEQGKPPTSGENLATREVEGERQKATQV
jgi:hypothetical protein